MNAHYLRWILPATGIVILAALAWMFLGKTITQGSQQRLATTFDNPILNSGADPYILHKGSNYYLTMTTGYNVTLWRSPYLSDIAAGEEKVVWSPATTNLQDIWAPEMHLIGKHWYIYFAADHDGNNVSHRIYILKSQGTHVMGPYTFVGQLHLPGNQWAIDGTILSLHGHRYFIWSGWTSPTNQVQHLFIARMSSATRVTNHASMISSPTYPWETSVAPINEGPQVLQHNGHTFLIFSANASWTNSYCLGMLTLTGKNPLNPNSWVKTPHPVFASANGVYGPGHCSFTTSENGQQSWIVYHAAQYSGAGWTRNIRTQKFTWNKNGTPDFGSPSPTSQSLSLPGGEPPTRIMYRASNAHDGLLQFHVHVSKAGLYRLYVRYNNNIGMASTQKLVVNGEPTYPLSLPNSGGLWSMYSTDIELNSGSNTLLIHTNGPFTSDIRWIEITTFTIP